MIGAPLFLLLLLPADDKPIPKLPLGKDTTYVTGPLDKDGYIDYEAALNDRLGKGVTPEKNANVLIWKAFGPNPEGSPKGVPDEFFKRLGIAKPPEKGDYFIGLTAYLRDHAKLARDQMNAVQDQQVRAGQRPWTAKDYPHLAGWLKANEKPLALVVEASRRPNYYYPLAPAKDEKDRSLIGTMFRDTQQFRESGNALAARAMLRTGEGRVDEAWQDLLACHRLARHSARGPAVVDSLVALALESIATRADLAYLDRAGLSAKEARACLKDLQELPPMPPLADTIDVGERFMFLDNVQLVRRGRISIKTLAAFPSFQPEKADPNADKALAAIDWEPALRNGNRLFDRMAAALRLKDRAKREQEVEGIENELAPLKERAAENWDDLLKTVEKGNHPGKEVSKQFGDHLISILVPNLGPTRNAFDRIEQGRRNVQLAFALAAYRSHQGRYPRKLEELAPTYLPAIPDDLFSGKALIYRPDEKGYLLYSVGVNGKDDGGRLMTDNPPGDDVGVRMPLPELKR
jgi:hypothetical protein